MPGNNSRPAILSFLSGFLVTATALAEQRFPPPDFEGGYKIPLTATPPARALLFQYADFALFLAAMGLALWLIHRRRSRRGVVALSIFSVAYFGFYRKGCICAIGSIQNVALALFDPSYALPLSALIFFIVPIAAALFGGRAFCAAVCPHGALQDLVLVKPTKLPAWLEHALGLIPLFFLGAGAVFAATGSAFLICRFDPFVPLFRLSGSSTLIGLGAAFLVIGVFVGRPYCRFLCPFGALLRMASTVSKWRVRVTPDTCTQCGLCRHSCPFGAMREPAPPAPAAGVLAAERKRLGWLLLLFPVLVGVGAFAGSKLSAVAARVHPAVELAEEYVDGVHQQQAGKTVTLPVRAERNPEETLRAAASAQSRFQTAGWLFGAWVGLVLGAKLIALSGRSGVSDFEPDRGACVGCARCFEYCPEERVRWNSGAALTPATGEGSKG